MSRASDRPRPWGVLVVLLLASHAAAAEDQLVIRPKLTLRDKKVQAFDVDGVRLEGGTVIGWEEIESGRLSRDQERFEKLLAALGDKSFRLGRALRTGDYASAVAPAEELYPSYTGRRSKAAYLVAQGLMWGRIAEGHREAAVEPYLQALEILRGSKEKPAPPGGRRLVVDLATGLCPELVPYFSDAQAAQEALPGVKRARESLARPTPSGLGLYVAALHGAAGNAAEAEAELAAVADTPRDLGEFKAILRVSLGRAGGRRADRDALESIAQGGLPASRPLARLVLGKAMIGSAEEAERRDGLIQLLHVPALFGEAQPELAAEALELSARTLAELGDAEADLLGKELQRKYAGTVAAGRARGNR